MNIVEYIKKYGKEDYEKLEFNNVDRLILSQFSYLKFDGLLPEVGENKPGITIGQLSKNPEIDKLFADERYEKNNRALFEAMAASPRFSLIRLNYYINIVDEKWEIQFSALTAILPNGQTHIVYRGTDESIIGWKEDLNMAFMTPIPAQEKAVDYINYISSMIDGDFSIGGHSKGGNLAVYAAMNCSSDIEARITRIDNHDGPGFSAKVLAESNYDSICGKIHKIVPHSSIVGMLLTTKENYEVVMCKNFGILQHDPFNWIVAGTDFIYRNEVTKSMMLRNDSINKWAENMTDEECKALSDDIYEAFVNAGIDNLNDFYKNPSQASKRLIEAVDSLDSDKRELVRNIMLMLNECFLNEAKMHFEVMKEETAAQLEVFKEEATAQMDVLMKEASAQYGVLKEEAVGHFEKFWAEAKVQLTNLKEETTQQLGNLVEEVKEQMTKSNDSNPDISDKSEEDEPDRTDRKNI